MADGTVHAPEANVGGNEESLLSNETEIVDGFVQCLGVSSDDAEEIFTNLLDYVDADCIPRDLGSPTTESVPMINEISVSNTLVHAAGMVRSVLLVSIEWAYPFVKPSPNAFEINYDITITPSAGTPAALIPVVPPGPVDSEYVAGDPLYVKMHKAVEISCESPPASNMVGRTVQFTVRVGAQVLQGGTVVDSAPFPFVPAQYFQVQTPATVVQAPPAPSSPQPCGLADGWECVDPRFNWDPNNPVLFQWLRYAPNRPGSLNATNAATLDWFADWGDEIDGATEMYVADEPLRTVGELSYVLRGSSLLESMWSTIRLVDRGVTPLDPVLDHFYLDTNSVLRGLVNPNTRSLDVLKAVFQGMPVDEYPGAPGTPLVGGGGGAPSATALATEMIKLSGSFTNRSDLGHAATVMSLYGATASPFQKESFVRNSAGLFHPRQNYFLVIVAAEVTEDVFLQTGIKRTTVRAAERAIAEVWRDPYPVSVSVGQKINPAFVRLFKILEE